MNQLIEKYDSMLEAGRQTLAHDRQLQALIDPTISPVLLERFYIQYSALAVQMTEPVEGWIRRAGERTVAVGLPEVGQKLQKHAKHEADHHLMLIEDTKRLVERWNARHTTKLDAERLLAQRPTRAMADYIALHEDTIESLEPFGQVAIELEIEGISVRFAPALLANTKRVLGAEFVEGLSFLTEHAAIDVGHTEFNNRLMATLLQARPEALDRMAQIGTRSLEIYVAFFGECLAMAREALRPATSAAPESRV